MPNIVYTRSRCVAKFYNFVERSNFTVDPLKTASFIEDDAIISCTVGREKASAEETFQMVFKPKKNYPDLIKPGDWVLIFLDDESNINVKDLTGLRCIGNVDRVALNTATLEDGSIARTYTISGTGFGKVFTHSEMFYNPYMNPELLKSFHVIEGYSITGSPYNFINGYLDLFLGDAKKHGLQDVLYSLFIPYDLYRDLGGQEREKVVDVSFYDILNKEFSDETQEGYSFARDISRAMTGSLWTLLQGGCNPLVNELFLDLRDGKPTLIFKKQPLTKDKRMEYANTTINDSKYQVPLKYVVNTNLGTSEHEVFNFLAIWPTNDLISDRIFAIAQAYNKQFPKVNKELIKRFGLRRFDRNTEYAYDQSAQLNGQILLQWVDELAEYWFDYYRFENGTIELRGKYDFEIGKFYYFPEMNKIFIVESVQYNWSFGQSIVTTITVTHGTFKNGDFIDTTATTNASNNSGVASTVFTRSNDKSFESVQSKLDISNISKAGRGISNVIS